MTRMQSGIFDEPRGVWKCGKTFRVFDISQFSTETKTKE